MGALFDIRYLLGNVMLVLLISVIYSLIELLNLKINTRTILTTKWGLFYLVLNGTLAVLALVTTFRSEVNSGIIMTKVILSGTSALALLRMIPVKEKSVSSNTVPMIEIILTHVRQEYDRERSAKDLKKIIEIMKGVDCNKAAEGLPTICSALLQTLSDKSARQLKEEIELLLTIEQRNEIKCVNLGVILSKYYGLNLLENSVKQLKEYIALDESGRAKNITESESENIDSLIDKYF